MSLAHALVQSVYLWLAATPSAAISDPVGGEYFFCGLFQAVKIASLCTGNVHGVLVGAIGGGLACGMGW